MYDTLSDSLRSSVYLGFCVHTIGRLLFNHQYLSGRECIYHSSSHTYIELAAIIEEYFLYDIYQAFYHMIDGCLVGDQLYRIDTY